MEKMDTDEMKDIVMEFIYKEFIEIEDTKITYDTPLITSGLIDSFSMVSLLVFLENKFKVKIPPDKATPDSFDSINKITALVKNHLK
jgi:acyl carrier protein/D-alanine--poly(phosphoribitol) ligase subunit 2